MTRAPLRSNSDLCFPVQKARHRVAIQSLVSSSDGQGGVTSTWATAATVWAVVEPLQGMERYVANQTQRNVSHRVTIRYRSGVTPAQRLVFDPDGAARVFNITSVIDPMERHVMLVLDALESTPDTTDG